MSHLDIMVKLHVKLFQTNMTIRKISPAKSNHYQPKISVPCLIKEFYILIRESTHYYCSATGNEFTDISRTVHFKRHSGRKGWKSLESWIYQAPNYVCILPLTWCFRTQRQIDVLRCCQMNIDGAPLGLGPDF